MRSEPIYRKRQIRSFYFFLSILMIVSVSDLYGQSHSGNKNGEKILFVDSHGVMHWKGTNKEPSFFGVNYTLPFAFDYRQMKQMGVNPEREIDGDVYHMARLGFDAFRLHIWDTEISDSLGHLLDNEHLKLLDYLLWKLKERGIRAILTPMNLYNNGYPQRPTKTPGFANYISKREAPQNPKYWPVMERYLKAFVDHVNPYTGLSYKDDPNILAVEILNEPDQAKTTEQTTRFVDSLAAAVRSTGWKKPIFYNLSQANTKYALAIAHAKINGASFQWYPAGLVRGQRLKGNYLPYVDRYLIPYRNNKRFKQLAKMVYEFSSADEPDSYIYPAMARSFRTAGFQFATQFTYTPMAIAYCNTDYQTHYLNLAYTPSKAISMLIASKVFHEVPLYKDFGSYPADTTFSHFFVSQSQNLSVMNADTAFYYTNNTETQPLKPRVLRHVAGVGSSPVVSYHGWGAYFLDKLSRGIWRLEVMPDAVPVRDPFERASPKKDVTYIEWKDHTMKIDLPGLGNSFYVKGINKGNTYDTKAEIGSFTIKPGTYFLVRKGVRDRHWSPNSRMGNIQVGEFVAPMPTPAKPIVRHTPYKSVTAGKPVTIKATVAGISKDEKVWLLVNAGFRPRPINMKQEDTYHYVSEIPANMVRPGFLSYRIVVGRSEDAVTFPGDHPGSPMDWDYYYKDAWQTKVYEPSSPILLYSAANGQRLDYSFSFWNRGFHLETISIDDPGKFAVKVAADKLTDETHDLGWQTYVAGMMKGRLYDINTQSHIVIRARSEHARNAPLHIILVDKKGTSYRTDVTLSDQFKDYSLSLSAFQPDSMMLLPRSFPGFLPLWFESNSNQSPDFKDLQSIQVVMGPGIKPDDYNKPYDFEVESIWLDND